jgi:hypothetical protein
MIDKLFDIIRSLFGTTIAARWVQRFKKGRSQLSVNAMSMALINNESTDTQIKETINDN